MSEDIADEPVTRDQPVTRAEHLSYLAIAAVQKVARALPTRTGRVLFGWLAWVGYQLRPGSRAVVASNQARVLGRAPDDPLVIASTKEAFRLYSRYWFDTFHVIAWPQEEVRRRFVFEGLEHVRAPLAAGTGVICVLPHMGNWDVAAMAMHANGFDVVSVAEVVRPPALFDLFTRLRQEMGVQVIGLTEGGRIGPQLSAELARNRLVALVADRDLTGRGVEVPMFGAPRPIPTGPAMLALISGAPIVVCGVFQRPDGWRCVMHPLPDVARTGDRRADVMAITKAMAEAFEDAISASPPDWHMFQPAWET